MVGLGFRVQVGVLVFWVVFLVLKLSFHVQGVGGYSVIGGPTQEYKLMPT